MNERLDIFKTKPRDINMMNVAFVLDVSNGSYR